MKTVKFTLVFCIVVALIFCFIGCDTDSTGDIDIGYVAMFDTQGGSVIDPINILNGGSVSLPQNPTKEGFVFGGWYLDSDCTHSFDEEFITSNIMLYAKWNECEHSIVVNPSLAPTCEKDGYTESSYCSICNAVIEEKVVVPASGHDVGENCKCANCNEYIHDLICHDGKEPTCTEFGYDEYYTCSRCDYTTYQVTAALGHQPDANCVCTVCGEAAHNYVNNICTVCGKSNLYSVEDGYIFFGTYPQSQVTDKTVIGKLTDQAGSLPDDNNAAGWTSYGYYMNGEVANYMWYTDLILDNEKYRGVYFTSYRGKATDVGSSANNSYQDDNGYILSTVYWFKYEPIKWRILSESNGEALILCEMIIDSQAYSAQGDYYVIVNDNKVYANNYMHSDIRTFLNDDFYNTAFSSLQKELILLTSVDNSERSTNPDNDATYFNDGANQYACENTNDFVFLLSEQEITTSTYGFSTSLGSTDIRIKQTTAYTQCQGAFVATGDFEGNGVWWLRSAYYVGDHNVLCVNVEGDVSYTKPSFNTTCGVVPALRIKLDQ